MQTNESYLTKKLLIAGIIAGPFFIVVSLLHGLLRPGFNVVHHPASLLSVGNLGWIQIATFILTGLMYIALGVGLRRVLTSGIGRRFVAPLFIVLGIAMVAGGVFTPDPSLGFPSGTPNGVPKVISWHSTIHGFAPIVGFLALVIALIILGRRFGSQGQRGWMWASIIVAVATLVLTSLPNFTANWQTGQFNFLPLWAGVALGFGFTSLVVAKLKNVITS
jgi:hypothetical membrane protein